MLQYMRGRPDFCATPKSAELLPIFSQVAKYLPLLSYCMTLASGSFNASLAVGENTVMNENEWDEGDHDTDHETDHGYSEEGDGGGGVH